MSYWDEEKVVELIENYKNMPILWDPRNHDYYKKHLKEDAWAQIGLLMSVTGEICKKKMVTILASWRREKAKDNKSQGTGKGRDEVYKSKWFAYSALDFLKDRDVPYKGMTTKDDANSEIIRDVEENTESTISQPPQKKSKSDPKLQMLKEAFGILKSSAEKPAPPPPLQDYPELRSFCDFIFQKMKNNTQQTINLIQQEILQIIFRADQGYYGHTHQSSNLLQPINYMHPTPTSLSTVNATTAPSYNFPQRAFVPTATESHSAENYSYEHGTTRLSSPSVAVSPPICSPSSQPYESPSPHSSCYNIDVDDLV